MSITNLNKDRLIQKVKLMGYRYCSVENVVGYNSQDTTTIVIFGNSFGIPEPIRDNIKDNVIITGVGCLESLDLHGTKMVNLTIDLDARVPSFKTLVLGFCSNLKNITFKSVNTTQLKSLNSSFMKCESLECLDLSMLDLNSICGMNRMCRGCEALKVIKFGDINAPYLTDLESAFYLCCSLETVQIGKILIPNCKTSHTTFGYCGSLERLDLSSVYIDKLDDVKNTFLCCCSLNKLDISNIGYDKSKAKNERIFIDCGKLKQVKIYGGRLLWLED